jgi:CubicO group peptidase (beta-lactamase class C family)
MAQVHGTTTEKFAALRDVLSNQLDSGADVGASIAVVHRDELVVDIWGGHTDAAKTKEWERDTIVNVWSTTKTMTFLVALMLVDRGELDFFAPVAKYWPEFAANGKENIEVRHLMAHSAGLSGWEDIAPEQIADWELSTAKLAAQTPWWTPGDGSGYHLVTQGHLIGEVVRRITGETIGQFFKREVADVLNADFHIGLPESEEHRVSIVIPPPPLDASQLGIKPGSVAYKSYTGPLLDATYPQHRWWRAAEIPAANGHGNARSVATIQAIIAGKGQTQGRRFFSEATSDLIFQSQSHGVDRILGTEIHFGMGYGLASSIMPLGPRACYWGGYGGSVIIMDQDADLTIAYMMNRMDSVLTGDVRGATVAMTAAIAAMS